MSYNYSEVIPLYNKKSGKICRAVNKILTCNWALRNFLYITAGIVFATGAIGFGVIELIATHPPQLLAGSFFWAAIFAATPYLLNLLLMIIGRVEFFIYSCSNRGYATNTKSKEVLFSLSSIEKSLWHLHSSLSKKSYAKNYVDKALNAIWEIIHEASRYAQLTDALKVGNKYDKNKPLEQYLAIAKEIEETTSLLVFRSISLNDSAHLQVVAMELQHCIDSVDELSALNMAA